MSLMFVQKAFRFRLRPNRQQEELLSQFAGACRWVYNRGLEERQRAYEERRKIPSLYDQNMELPRLKREEETAWLKGVHSQVLQQALADLDLAYSHAYRRLKSGEHAGFPHFRCKGRNDSFRYPQGVRIFDSVAYLPKIGYVRFRQSRPLEGRLLQTTVVREADKWYISFACEMEVSSPILDFSDEKCIGIDLGIEYFATIADSQTVEQVTNPKWLNRDLKHLRYLSRQLSKRKKKSKNWYKALAALRAFHARLRNRRADFLHKLSTQIVQNHDLIGVESLCVKELLGDAPRSLARAISDAGWRHFLQMLKYKCEQMGKRLVEAGRYFASSQLCSNCGARQQMPLQMRTYECSCGLKLHRDHNSALNLRAAGMSVLKACGAAPCGSVEAGIFRL